MRFIRATWEHTVWKTGRTKIRRLTPNFSTNATSLNGRVFHVILATVDVFKNRYDLATSCSPKKHHEPEKSSTGGRKHTPGVAKMKGWRGAESGPLRSDRIFESSHFFGPQIVSSFFFPQQKSGMFFAFLRYSSCCCCCCCCWGIPSFSLSHSTLNAYIEPKGYKKVDFKPGEGTAGTGWDGSSCWFSVLKRTTPGGQPGEDKRWKGHKTIRVYDTMFLDCLLRLSSFYQGKYINVITKWVTWLYMDVSKNRGTPKWMVCNGKPYINPWMIWGYHYFRKHPISFSLKLTASLPLKIGRKSPKGTEKVFLCHPFSGALAVSFRERTWIYPPPRIPDTTRMTWSIFSRQSRTKALCKWKFMGWG